MGYVPGDLRKGQGGAARTETSSVGWMKAKAEGLRANGLIPPPLLFFFKPTFKRWKIARSEQTGQSDKNES